MLYRWLTGNILKMTIDAYERRSARSDNLYARNRIAVRSFQSIRSFSLARKLSQDTIWRYCQMLWISHVRQPSSLTYPTDDPAQRCLVEP